MTPQERYPILSEEVEDWIEAIVDDLMERYERAGTPVKGGFPIANALRLAYLTGKQNHDQI